ncbi:MAG: DUF2934 domain-containing protein [Rhodocyclaceae bacterium]|nr:DUF2934 domain-containing protein [Rhodocyclaceae bacterium]
MPAVTRKPKTSVAKATPPARPSKVVKAKTPPKATPPARPSKVVKAKAPPKAAAAMTKAKAPVKAKAPAVAKPAAAPRPRRTAAPKVDPDQHRHYVQIAAYFIAEQRGFLGGCDVEDWVLAENEIDRMLREGKLSR